MPNEACLVSIEDLIAAYFADQPNPLDAEQRVKFGTSGHRGSAFSRSFNEWHVLAISQAICIIRKQQGISGPLFLGLDTHALSKPACMSVMEVLAANRVDVMLAIGDQYTPTPAVSHAILKYNRNRPNVAALSDGIVLSPSHNPPQDGGIKYNPPHGGPADTEITRAIEELANRFMLNGLAEVLRVDHSRALAASTTHRYDFLGHYVNDLDSVLDMSLIRDAGVHIGVDPMGGAGVNYWSEIASRWNLNLTVIDNVVDPTFGFMHKDWDGQIRMDPSSNCVMQGLVASKDLFDVSIACDTDHDRHGVVTPSHGLLASNQYLSVCIDYLFRNRAAWSPNLGVGKTLVSSQMIDRISAELDRELYEVPVGFKWFVPQLTAGRLGFCGEESAGATFVRRCGDVWTTDKDGIIAGLLAAEITAKTGENPGQRYAKLTQRLGEAYSLRIDAPVETEKKSRLSKLTPLDIQATQLGGENIVSIECKAAGNGELLGGIKVSAANGWWAARPSGTEDIYKIYAESFKGNDHLQQIVAEAQSTVLQAVN